MLLDLLQELQKTARCVTTFYETELASSNDKLIAHLVSRLQADRPNVFAEWVPCLSHQTHHVQGHLLSLCGFSILNKLYGCCHLPQVSGNFNRLRMAVRPWLEGVVPWRTRLGFPPLRSERFAACILSYFEAHFAYFDSLRQGRRKAAWKQSLKQALHPKVCRSCGAMAFLEALRSLLKDWSLRSLKRGNWWSTLGVASLCAGRQLRPRSWV